MGYLKDCLDDITSLDEIIDESKDFLKKNYDDLLIFNGKLLIAEGFGSAVGAGAGEILKPCIENDLVTTILGTGIVDGLIACPGAYTGMAYLERRNNKKAFRDHREIWESLHTHCPCIRRSQTSFHMVSQFKRLHWRRSSFTGKDHSNCWIHLSHEHRRIQNGFNWERRKENFIKHI